MTLKQKKEIITMPSNIICDLPHEVKRVAIYVRVSTAEQRDSGISVDDQIDELTRWVSDHGHIQVDIYNDAGHTAHAAYNKRPELMRLLADCKQQKIDLIVFTKLDRWFRSVPDYYAVQKVLDDCKVNWMATREDYETITANGRFVLNVMLSIAENEAMKTSERVKATFAYKRSLGEWTGGTPPTGYKLDNMRMVIDPETELFVRTALNGYIQTKSIARTQRLCDELGFHWSINSFRKLLKRECYATGVYRDVPCPTYITLEQHNEILRIFKLKSRKTKENNTYMFSGLCKCGQCGRHYSGVTSRNKRRYICGSMKDRMGCKNPSVSEAIIEAAIIAQIDEKISEQYKPRKTKKTPQRSTKALEAKLERLRECYIDGDLSRVEYDRRRSDITKQINELKATNNRIPEVYNMPSDWKETYSQLTQENKQSFWRGIISDIVIVGKNFTVTYN